MAAGSRFVRADLHVHTTLSTGERASGTAPTPELVVAAARRQGVAILGITDHNSVANVRGAVALSGPDLLVLPGIEISTADGHLLGLFSPENISELEGLARADVLRLSSLPDGSQRSVRSMADLVAEIDRRGGLAIAAHVDKPDSLLERANAAALSDLLAQAGLAGIEITQPANATLFSETDGDRLRKQGWVQREKLLGLRAPLARIMSSDAHSVEAVGADKASRTLTRLRVDALNFRAVRAALAIHPDSRCKLESSLEVQYPRVVSAKFEGGFVNGLSVEFSPNLNCLIGGRGSGKSTCLLAIMGVLNGTLDDALDAHLNQPDYTEVVFIDGLGSTRRAGRTRHGETFDVDAPTAALTLPYADLEQDFGGELRDDDPQDPRNTFAFLARFFDLEQFESQDLHLRAKLDENADLLRRTTGATDKLKKLRESRLKLGRALSTATNANLAKVAEYAKVLAAESPLLDELSRELASLPDAQLPEPPDLKALAEDFGVDLRARPASNFVSGAAGLEAELNVVGEKLRKAESATREEVKTWIEPAQSILERWRKQHASWDAEIEVRRKKMQAEGLSLQVEQLDKIRTDITRTDLEIRKREEWEKQYRGALTERESLLGELRRLRDRRHFERKKQSDALVGALNAGGPGAVVSIKWVRAGMRANFADRLGQLLDLHSPRKQRLASAIDPADLADIVWKQDRPRLVAIGTEAFFPDADLAFKALRTFDVLFELETMDLEDRPEIRVHFSGELPGAGHALSELSLGQLRSVVLGFVLSTPGNAPLILDQPEEQLDGPFVATTVVRYVYGSKERRQLIVATHNPNLVVLGDAELVIPLEVKDGLAEVVGSGSVDNDETCEQIVKLLEGGRPAFERRARRYGFNVEPLV